MSHWVYGQHYRHTKPIPTVMRLLLIASSMQHRPNNILKHINSATIKTHTALYSNQIIWHIWVFSRAQMRYFCRLGEWVGPRCQEARWSAQKGWFMLRVSRGGWRMQSCSLLSADSCFWHLTQLPPPPPLPRMPCSECKQGCYFLLFVRDRELGEGLSSRLLRGMED